MKVNSNNYYLLLLFFYLSTIFFTVQTLPIFSSPTAFISSLAVKKNVNGKKLPALQQSYTVESDDADNEAIIVPHIVVETVAAITLSATTAPRSHTVSSSRSDPTGISDTHYCLEKEGVDHNVPLERLAQLIATHWQFDHLDSIKSATYKLISEQFQKHISVSLMKPQQHDYHSPLLQHHFQKLSSNNKKEPFANSSPPTTITTSATTTTTTSSTTLSWDTMDLEILHAQIFGAVQAHTEGSLHLAWDRLADTLGQPALESYIRGIISRHCLNSTITSPALAKSINTNANRGNGSVNENMVLSSCLKSKAAQISAELDGYVRDNLIQIFTILDEDILPQLLANTSKDLTDVLDYFNRLFFNNNEHQYTLRLEVTPWTHHSQTKEEENHILKLKLIPLFDHSLSNDDHLSEFFSNYACLSSA